MKKLETNRLILRAFTLDDIYDVYEYAKKENIGPNAGWKPHDSLEVTRQIVQMFIVSNDVWAIVLKENNKVIGSIGLHDRKKRVGIAEKEIGYVLNDTYWNLGYMSEAIKKVINYGFYEENLEVINCNHFVENIRSQKVILKAGFKLDGTIKKYMKLFNGKVVDLATYSLFKEENV